MKATVKVSILLVGLTVFCWTGSSASQSMECTIITQIAGRQVTLTPENPNLKPFVIEIEDLGGLKVGDRVWVEDGKIVSCALPGRVPAPGKKP